MGSAKIRTEQILGCSWVMLEGTSAMLYATVAKIKYLVVGRLSMKSGTMDLSWHKKQ